MTTSNSTTKALATSLVIPSLLALALVLKSKQIVANRPSLRKRITKNVLWKTQFVLHPVIVFVLLDRASQTQSTIYASLIVPFAFNFAVEPFDIPTDPIFLSFFYLHHYAIVLAAAILAIFSDDNNDSLFEFGRSQALLLGHGI